MIVGHRNDVALFIVKRTVKYDSLIVCGVGVSPGYLGVVPGERSGGVNGAVRMNENSLVLVVTAVSVCTLTDVDLALAGSEYYKCIVIKGPVFKLECVVAFAPAAHDGEVLLHDLLNVKVVLIVVKIEDRSASGKTFGALTVNVGVALCGSGVVHLDLVVIYDEVSTVHIRVGLYGNGFAKSILADEIGLALVCMNGVAPDVCIIVAGLDSCKVVGLAVALCAEVGVIDVTKVLGFNSALRDGCG